MPPGVQRLRADPVTGMVLADWCVFSTPDARSEVFLEGHVPPTGCPIPSRRSFFGRTFGWFEELFEDEEEGRDRRERAGSRSETGRDEGQDRPRRLRIRILDDLSPSRDRTPGVRR